MASGMCQGMACDPRGGVGFVPVYRALHFQGREQSRRRPRFYLLVSAGFACETAGAVQGVPVTRSSRAHARLRLDTLWLRWGFLAGVTGWSRAARWVDAPDGSDITPPPAFQGQATWLALWQGWSSERPVSASALAAGGPALRRHPRCATRGDQAGLPHAGAL